MYLKEQRRIRDAEVNRYFWQGLHRNTRRAIDRRLGITTKNFDRSAPLRSPLTRLWWQAASSSRTMHLMLSIMIPFRTVCED